MFENNVVYTSTNTYISVNDNVLGFVQSIEIEDKTINGEKVTDITLHRLVNDHEDVINDMRKGTFVFKLYSSANPQGYAHTEHMSGYLASEAEVVGFKMYLSAKLSEEVQLLEQTIIIRTKLLVHTHDINSVKLTEEEDLKNLIEIIKKNQEAKVPAVVLPVEKVKSKKKNKTKRA